MLVHLLALGYGIPFILVGIEHFRSPQKFVDIVPNYLPFALFLVYLTGIIEIVGGLGIIYPETREITGRLMVLFLIAVYPANFNMWINDIPYNGTRLTTQGHLVRLSVQFLLIIAALGFSGDLEKLGKFKK
ncbi:MAG: hypothetical protein BET99_01405 [Marine Group III euryarchaeote CG-Epi2]|uniref:DoxX family protein n=1 Tax=Marine Group III euryarchaeote CG-Epi2 TaxID=1888996 RepID=A0A1J5TLL4_9ARCH|nr:MAG: hypothetical protein BET99_01405 [Marine Group III euryarchaeote CG-Epi2]